MSIYGFAGNAAAKYKTALNLRSAVEMTKLGWYAGGIKSGLKGGINELFGGSKLNSFDLYAGAVKGAAKGFGGWAMGGSATERAVRMGTVAAAAGGAYIGARTVGGIVGAPFRFMNNRRNKNR